MPTRQLRRNLEGEETFGDVFEDELADEAAPRGVVSLHTFGGGEGHAELNALEDFSLVLVCYFLVLHTEAVVKYPLQG